MTCIVETAGAVNTVLYHVVREGGPAGPGSDPAEESQEVQGGVGVECDGKQGLRAAQGQQRPVKARVPEGDPTQPVIFSNSPSLLNEQLPSMLRGGCPCGSFREIVTVTVSLGRDYKYKLNLVCRNTRIRANGRLDFRAVRDSPLHSRYHHSRSFPGSLVLESLSTQHSVPHLPKISTVI